MKIEAYDLTVISESWGDDPDDFFIQVHCEVWVEEEFGGEAFVVNFVSPKALAKILAQNENEFSFEFGRGYIIINDFDKRNLLIILNRFLNGINLESFESLYNYVDKYFNWI